VYRALNLNTGQMVAVKRIGLEGLKEEEIAQLMREVDLVKRLSHPSIVKYEGMARDENTLSIVLEYVTFILPFASMPAVAAHLVSELT
jgi:serine/threonine protein kinase